MTKRNQPRFQPRKQSKLVHPPKPKSDAPKYSDAEKKQIFQNMINAVNWCVPVLKTQIELVTKQDIMIKRLQKREAIFTAYMNHPWWKFWTKPTVKEAPEEPQTTETIEGKIAPKPSSETEPKKDDENGATERS